MCVCMCPRARACVCERERGGERERQRDRERERERTYQEFCTCQRISYSPPLSFAPTPPPPHPPPPPPPHPHVLYTQSDIASVTQCVCDGPEQLCVDGVFRVLRNDALTPGSTVALSASLNIDDVEITIIEKTLTVVDNSTFVDIYPVSGSKYMLQK